MPLGCIACYVMDRSAQSWIKAKRFEARYIRSAAMPC
jgi:hypothetical protein